MKNKMIWWSIISISVLNCRDQLPTQPTLTIEKPIVESYIIAEKPFPPIKLYRANDLDHKNINNYIIDAHVQLFYNDSLIEMIWSDKVKGYIIPGENIIPHSGDQFSLYASAGKHTVEASTTVPVLPIITSIHSTVSPDYSKAGSSNNITYHIHCTASDETIAYYQFFVKRFNLFENGQNDGNFEIIGLSQFHNSAFSYKNHLYETFTFNSEELQTARFVFYIFFVKQEYVKFYQSSLNRFNQLDRGYSNIRNGSGIFTAVAMDSVNLEIPDKDME